MPVRAELSRRRLLSALLLVAVLPATLAFAAVSYSTPAAPPGAPTYNPVPLDRDEVLIALLNREVQRGRRVIAAATPEQLGPQLLPATVSDPLPLVFLPARPKPYDLTEVQAGLPSIFEESGDGLLLRASVVIPEGAQLTISGKTTPTLRLASSPTGFSTLIALGGTLSVQGTTREPVTISSWDPDNRAVDLNPSDGRSFLLTMGGRMNLAHSDIGYLGFGTGTSSGAAWRSADHVTTDVVTDPAIGEVTNTVLHNNWFGAYTFEAEGMRWAGNTFADNIAYGFDPHDRSNNFVVENNVAYGNGRHGFIFSRGCDNNIMRNNVSYDNRGHGFMIDDGRSADADYADASRLDSNFNQVLGNHAYDNDGNGIEIEGGKGNVVSGNLVERNHVGVRLKNGASVVVSDNTINDSSLAGVDVLRNTGKVDVTDNTISGGWASIALGVANGATLANNSLSNASTPLSVAGEAVRGEDFAGSVGRLFSWNPLLVLWTAILGVPMILGLHRLGRWVVARVSAPFRSQQQDAPKFYVPSATDYSGRHVRRSSRTSSRPRTRELNNTTRR